MERRLWLNLSGINERDQAFLLNVPLSPSGLFSVAVSSVFERFQEAKFQSAAFKRFIPRCSSSHGAAVSLLLLISSKAESVCLQSMLIPSGIRAQGTLVFRELKPQCLPEVAAALQSSRDPSQEMAVRHRDIHLVHIRRLGLRLNAKKRVPLTLQKTMFWIWLQCRHFCLLLVSSLS